MEHVGRHAKAYHEFMYQAVKAIDTVAQGNMGKFLEGFWSYLKDLINLLLTIQKFYQVHFGIICRGRFSYEILYVFLQLYE